MKNFIQEHNIKPGDKIIVPKSNFEIIEHDAIYLGKTKRGVDMIAENKIGHCVRFITATEFSKDILEIIRIERFIGTNAQRMGIVKRCLVKKGLPYDLILYNCQHFAEDLQYCYPESRQVKNVQEIVGITAILFLGIGLFSEFSN